MTSGELIAPIIFGAGIAALGLAALVDRRNGNRHDTPRAAIHRVSWRSLQAINEAQNVDRPQQANETGPTCHGTHTGVTR